jgi:hypothetical protein
MTIQAATPTGPAPVRIDTETFYAGFLLALKAQDFPGFVADGRAFHHAFGLAVSCARQLSDELVVDEMDWMGMDPIYGVMPHAEELVAFGQSARMLSLENPNLVRAKIRGTKEDANKELEVLGHRDWFLQVAKVFGDSIVTA